MAISGSNHQGWVGVGEIQGHLRLGAYGQARITPNFSVATGDDAASMTLPTDIFTGGQYILTRGVGVLLGGEGSKNRIYAFGGSTSLGYGAGFFRAAVADQEIGLLYFDRKLSERFRFFSRNAFGGKQTSIHGLEWKVSKAISTAAAAGEGSGKPYFAGSFAGAWTKFDVKAALSESAEQFRRLAVPSSSVSEISGANGSITYRPWSSVSLSASHNRYVTFDFDRGISLTATTDQGSANFSLAQFGLGGSVYETSVSGHSSQAYSLFASRPVGRWLNTTVTTFRSERPGGGADTMVVANASEKVHPRVTLSQFVTRANGATNVTFGGQLYTNPLRVSLDYQNVYVPYDFNQPFRQALSLNATVRAFGGTELTLGTFVDPLGKLRYTISINRYLYRNGRTTRAESAAQWSMSKYLVRGRVVDEHGNVVEGAAVSVGGHFAYTNSEGRFFVRMAKQKLEPFRVLPDDFTAPGFWKVLSAPDTAMPMPEEGGTEIEIRVKQLSGEEALRRLEHQRQRQPSSAALASTGS